MSELETVLYSVSNRVATITLNRPESLNSFNPQQRIDFLTAVDRANADSDVRVVIITGAGRAFSSGADLADDTPEPPNETVERMILRDYKPTLRAIGESDKLFIAAINGACAGVGSGVATACDFVVMAENAYLYLAFAAVGLVPDGGISYHLVKSLGYMRALQLIVEGGRLTPKQCVEAGLANKVMPGEELLSQTQAWAESLAEGSPLAQKLSKQIARKALTASPGDIIDLEAKLQVVTVGSEDHENAVKAFFNKETPVFMGK